MPQLQGSAETVCQDHRYWVSVALAYNENVSRIFAVRIRDIEDFYHPTRLHILDSRATYIIKPVILYSKTA